MINDQFIGKINGLKLELDLKKGALETDIKSLKKQPDNLLALSWKEFKTLLIQV